MDFHSLTRRELQTLCKKNKIQANLTNVAMADALKALEKVDGIEEITKTSASSLTVMKGSPDNTGTNCRTSARRKTIISEEHSVQRTYGLRRSVRLSEKKMDEPRMKEVGRKTEPIQIDGLCEEISKDLETNLNVSDDSDVITDINPVESEDQKKSGVDLPTFSEEVSEGTEDLKHPSSGIPGKLSENMEDSEEDVLENNSNNGISDANETNDDNHESNSNQEIVNSVVNSNIPISDILNQENHDGAKIAGGIVGLMAEKQEMQAELKAAVVEEQGPHELSTNMVPMNTQNPDGAIKGIEGGALVIHPVNIESVVTAQSEKTELSSLNLSGLADEKYENECENEATSIKVYVVNLTEDQNHMNREINGSIIVEEKKDQKELEESKIFFADQFDCTKEQMSSESEMERNPSQNQPIISSYEEEVKGENSCLSQLRMSIKESKAVKIERMNDDNKENNCNNGNKAEQLKKDDTIIRNETLNNTSLRQLKKMFKEKLKIAENANNNNNQHMNVATLQVGRMMVPAPFQKHNENCLAAGEKGNEIE